MIFADIPVIIPIVVDILQKENLFITRTVNELNVSELGQARVRLV